jgi:undecaprenyl-diphosphatase
MNIRQLIDTDALVSARLRLKPDRRWIWRLAVFFAHSGDSWFWMAGLVIVWLVTRGAWHDRAALLALGVGGLAVTVLAIKFSIRRQRPEGEWGAIYRNTDPHSFPSGHAARAFMLAVMAVLLGPAWFAVLLVIWAPLVSLARVATGVHYLTDILAGALLGGVVGWLLVLLQPVVQLILPFLFS